MADFFAGNTRIPISQAGMMRDSGAAATATSASPLALSAISSPMSLLAATGSFFSSGIQAYASRLQGKMEQRRLQMNAKFQEAQANQIEINAQEQVNIIRNELLNNIASTEAFFAARNIDVGSAGVQSVIDAGARNANLDINATNMAAKRQARMTRVGASQTRSDASLARTRGKLNSAKAMQNMLESGADIYSGLNALNKTGLLNG